MSNTNAMTFQSVAVHLLEKTSILPFGFAVQNSTIFSVRRSLRPVTKMTIYPQILLLFAMDCHLSILSPRTPGETR